MELLKKFSISKIKPWIKLLLIICALFIAYLFALNGRYTKIYNNEPVFFDKWRTRVIVIDDFIDLG